MLLSWLSSLAACVGGLGHRQGPGECACRTAACRELDRDAGSGRSGRLGSGAGCVLAASAPEEAIRPPSRKPRHRRLSIGPRARQGIGERAELGCPGSADFQDGRAAHFGLGGQKRTGCDPGRWELPRPSALPPRGAAMHSLVLPRGRPPAPRAGREHLASRSRAGAGRARPRPSARHAAAGQREGTRGLHTPGARLL